MSSNAFGRFFLTLTGLLFVCSLVAVLAVTETLRDLPERFGDSRWLTQKREETST